MQIKKSARKKKLLIIVILCLAAVGAVIAYTYVNGAPSDKLDKAPGVNYDKPTQEQVDAGYEAKKQSLDSQSSGNDESKTSSGPALNITALNQADGIVSIRATVDTTSAVGTCNLSMATSGSSTFNQEVGLQDYGTYSVCKGFDIPESQLAKGTWSVSVSYSNGDSKSTVTRSIEIR